MGSRERRSEMETQGEEDSYMFYRVQAHGVRWSSPHAASAATGNASPPLRSIPGMVWVSLSSSFLSLSSSGSPNSSSLVSQTPSSFAPVASSSLSMGERERDDRFPYEISLSDIESIEYVSRGVFSKTSSCRFERKLEKGSFVEIDFHKDHSDCKAFVEVIRSAVSRRDKRMRAEAKSERELEDGDDQQTSTTSSSPFFVQGAGVGGIMRRFEERGRQTEASVNDAFQNLDTLFEHASQLISLVERYREVQLEKRDEKSLPTSLEMNDEEDHISDFLHNLGLRSAAVSRTMASSESRYFQSLASQLSEFLLDPKSVISSSGQINKKSCLLDRLGGTVLVVDVYCMYNKARRLDLVSPNDIISACREFPSVGSPLRMESLGANKKSILVIQRECTSSSVAERVLLCAEKSSSGLTPLSWSTMSGVSLSVAMAQLENAEKSLLLCRDEAVDAVHFFPNRFLPAS